MAELAIKGHETRCNEIIEILEMLGGKNQNLIGWDDIAIYYIRPDGYIGTCYTVSNEIYKVFTIEEFLEKFPYKVGNKVIINGDDSDFHTITSMRWHNEEEQVYYDLLTKEGYDMCSWEADEMIPYKEQKTIPPYMDYDVKTSKKETMEDKGNISDGYHTFNELYEYRLLYNASMFNELAKQGLYDVHKSKLHSDGTIPFGDENWFIVQAELPTGQISNHYEIKDWNLFQVPVKEKANPYDGHSPQDVAKRLREFLTPKPKYPKTYKECCDALGLNTMDNDAQGYKGDLIIRFQELIIARDAYWKIAGDWKPDFMYCDLYCIGYNGNVITWKMQGGCRFLAFPTAEMRDAFYENFKDLIEAVKELL